eukprot:c27670_g2_i2 orf=250-1374(+)
MTDQKVRLLSGRPGVGTAQDAPLRSGIPPRPLFQGLDVLGAKKRGQSVRSWIRIDTFGNSQVLEVDKLKIMRRCDLPARDLRLLDPLFVYPSTILGREKAIVVNLEQIRCIITADEVLLLNSLDSYVLEYVTELQRRLAGRSEVNRSDFRWRSKRGYVTDHPLDQTANAAPETSELRVGHDVDIFSGLSADYLPFEFRALEVALEAACMFLDTQATELEVEAYPVLDELTSKVSTPNLERARRLKSRLVALTRRVQKVRDEIEQLMDDDGDMAEMYLTDKKERMEAAFQRDQALFSYTSLGTGGSISAPVSPVHSPTESHKLEKTFSLAKSRHSSTRTSEDENEHIEELEMLLEAYFVVIDGTLNKLTSVWQLP